MRTKILKLTALATVALAAIALAHAASFYRFAEYPILEGGTNQVPPLSTGAVHVVSCTKSTGVLVYVDFDFHAAPGAGDTNGLRVDFYRGMENGSYESNVFRSWLVSPDGPQLLDIHVGAVPYLGARLVNVSTNARGTNMALRYGFKN